jgi:hypothetical protein
VDSVVVVKAGASGRQVKLSALGWRDFGYGSGGAMYHKAKCGCQVKLSTSG